MAFDQIIATINIIELNFKNIAMKSTLAVLSWLAFASGSAVQQKDLPTVDLGYQVHRAISFDV